MFIGYYSSSWTRQKSAKPNAGINPRSKKDAKETGSGRWVLKNNGTELCHRIEREKEKSNVDEKENSQQINSKTVKKSTWGTVGCLHCILHFG
jgi:hypothetical protein